jgi:site-specific recombinase XerD
MLDDMTLRKLSEQTQRAYIRSVERFARFFGQSPDLAAPEDLRRFQMQLVSDGVSTTTINATITGLRFFFEVTLDRPEALKKMSPLNERRGGQAPARRCTRVEGPGRSLRRLRCGPPCQ